MGFLGVSFFLGFGFCVVGFEVISKVISISFVWCFGESIGFFVFLGLSLGELGWVGMRGFFYVFRSD